MSSLSRKAEAYLHEGDLDEAGKTLDLILGQEEKQIDRTAADRYNRALVFLLQFQSLEAIPQLDRAYQYRPEEIRYGWLYAISLLDQHEFQRAEPVFLATLAEARARATANPSLYKAYVAKILGRLARLYVDIQRLDDARVAFHEALDIDIELTQTDPSNHPIESANDLNDLGIVYEQSREISQAEAAFLGALDIIQHLAAKNPDAYRLNTATELGNLATLYCNIGRRKEAENEYHQALAIDRQLARENPPAYKSCVVMVRTNLRLLFFEDHRMQDAEQAYNEALGIYRGLATSTGAYDLDLSSVLNNIANVYLDTERAVDASAAYEEALAIDQRLVKTNRTAYLDHLALTLLNLTSFYLRTGGPRRPRVPIRTLWLFMSNKSKGVPLSIRCLSQGF